jgi:hypothetical protein
LNGLSQRLLLVHIGVAQLGRPCKILVHVSEYLRELR